MFLFQSCTWHEPAPLKLNDFNDDLADLRKSTVANKVYKNEFQRNHGSQISRWWQLPNFFMFTPTFLGK